MTTVEWDQGAEARRTAIESGLKDVLTEPEVRQGLVLWDQIFSTRPNPSIPHFIEILGTLLRLNDRDRLAARLSVMRCLMTGQGGDEELPRVAGQAGS